MKTRKVRVKYVNGVQVNIEEVEPYRIIKEPINLVIRVGTKSKEPEDVPPSEGTGDNDEIDGDTDNH